MNKSQLFEIVAPSPQCFSYKHLNYETLRCPAFGEKQIPRIFSTISVINTIRALVTIMYGLKRVRLCPCR